MTLRRIAWLLPSSEWACCLAQAYVDRVHGYNNHDCRTNGELRFLRRVLPACRTVFDVGANIGDWAQLAFDINPLLHLHCFEPSNAAFRQLIARHIAVCNNVGLGSSSGSHELWVFPDHPTLNSLYRRTGLGASHGLLPQTQREEIRLETLDEYLATHPIEIVDLLKLDVEGHELEVLKGSVGSLSSGRIKIIQFEYGGCNIDARVLLKDLLDFLGRFGYRFFKVLPHGLAAVSCYEQRFENFQYQNWVAALPGYVV